ncbi:hypothetical protein ABZ517_16525 [Streptomyces scabiei]|uniref:hypothetical protein n=1 Tax=Streptomyces scabiei TaxID=1930 RepID=UPI0033CD9367
MQLPFNPADYQRYSIKAPLGTHFRPATCQEVDCPQYRNGWRTRLEVLNPRDRHYVLKESGRRYRLQEVAEGETYAVFEPGQQCFQVSRHRARVHRPEAYSVADGRRLLRSHTKPEFWIEDLHEYSDKYQQLKKKG